MKPRAIITIILECQVFTYTKPSYDFEEISEDQESNDEEELNKSKDSMLDKKDEDMKEPKKEEGVGVAGMSHGVKRKHEESNNSKKRENYG